MGTARNICPNCGGYIVEESYAKITDRYIRGNELVFELTCPGCEHELTVTGGPMIVQHDRTMMESEYLTRRGSAEPPDRDADLRLETVDPEGNTDLGPTFTWEPHRSKPEANHVSSVGPIWEEANNRYNPRRYERRTVIAEIWLDENDVIEAVSWPLERP